MSKLLTQRARQWQKILDLTRQMRALSIEKELEKLTTLQQQRQSSIETFFASPVTETEAEQVAAGIREILASDQLIYQQSEKVKSDIGGSLQKVMGNRKALDAYHGVSRT
ncbi:MAG: flagellar protein FliT [Gammaproteobacteria bacterium]|nr:flagellar protein FliT [Gammaproteobacteria bacterium]